MTGIFLDTSALAKRYHVESGTESVDRWMSSSVDVRVISRLSVVELHSVFAKKIRIGLLKQSDFDLMARRFRHDIASKTLCVARMLVADFRRAESLIRKWGSVRNLRTLDAIQLATALRMNDASPGLRFLSADQSLCDLATAEGLAVTNPELDSVS